MRFETLAIHAGQEPEKTTGAVVIPVYQTTTYQQDAIGKHRGFEYSRTGNPTRAALETALASLENGKYGLAFASGLAASSAVLRLLNPGDHIISGSDIYGGTFRLFEKVYRPWGLNVDYASVDDLNDFKLKLTPNTKLIWLETPTNPLLNIADIRKIADFANENSLILVVDNTFATPYFQKALDLGARIVVHSTTKYLGGHSDSIGGAVITSNEDIYQKVKFYQNAEGAIPGPWDSWLILRGIKTLSVRMREHASNAQSIAELLSCHPAVEKVYYPGLKSHPGHDTAVSQMSGFGGMVSFVLKGNRADVDRFFSRLQIFTLAESLGGVESLACYPAAMTHASIPAEERQRRGIVDTLIRLSVGIESVGDLRSDLENALG